MNREGCTIQHRAAIYNKPLLFIILFTMTVELSLYIRGLPIYRRPLQTTADQCIFVLIFDIKDTFYA